MKNIYILFFFYFVNTNAQTVTTLAGSIQGYTDGIGISSQFNGPAGVDLAPDGSIIVADRLNHRIRKISPSGVVTTVAGSQEGYADGIGTDALFSYPMNLSVDAAGIIYVVDSGNHRIRKITTDGTVTTLAGHASGFTDGNSEDAQFNYPEGIFIASSGIIYVADAGNHAVRKIMPDGNVTTLAGGNLGHADGIGINAQFWTPCGITVDPNGIIYVTEKKNRIRKITSDGVVTTFVGSDTPGYLDGIGTAAKLNSPFDITMDANGNLYVTDSGNNRIRKILPDGSVSTFAGSTNGYLDGIGTAAKFNYPIGICIAADGTIYIGESGNGKIRKITTVLDSSSFNLEDTINAYPNPFTNFLTINLENLTKATVFSVLGQLIQEKTFEKATSNTMDLSHLKIGTYLIVLENNILQKTIKIVKQ